MRIGIKIVLVVIITTLVTTGMFVGTATAGFVASPLVSSEVSFSSDTYYLGMTMSIHWALEGYPFGTIMLKDPNEAVVKNWRVDPGSGNVTYNLSSTDPAGVWTVTLSTLNPSQGDPFMGPDPGGPSQPRRIILASDTAFVDIFDWLYIAYVDGDNDLKVWADTKINNLRSIGSSNGIGIFALVDYHGTYMNGETYAYYIEPGNLVEIPLSEIHPDWTNEVNMGDGATLVTWATYVLTKYPCSHEFLHIYDHGGPLPGDMCSDWTQGDVIRFENDEFHNAIMNVASATADGFIDVIGLDMCTQSALELGYEIRNDARYMVAFEPSAGASVWPTSQFTSYLVNNPDMTPKEFAHGIIDIYNGNRAFAACNLSLSSSLAGALDDLASALITKLSGIHQRSYYNKITSVIQHENLRRFNTVLMDIYDFALLLQNAVTANGIKQRCQTIMTLFNETIYCNPSDDGNGLSIFFPPNEEWYNHAYSVRYLRLPYDFTEDTLWDEFIAQYFQSAPQDIPVLT